MFKAIRIAILLVILFFVSLSTFLTQARSTDWNNSLYVKVYPINGDGSGEAERYIERLKLRHFEGIENFVAREAERYGKTLKNPVRMELGEEINEQPPSLSGSPSTPSVMWWSLKMRWWAGDITEDQDRVEPDVKIFIRYHTPVEEMALENSVGLQKGMVGIVNAFAGNHHTSMNNVVIAHEFLHTLGATDKYEGGTGQPLYPHGYAEPDRKPLYPQKTAEIMGGRIPESEFRAVIPRSLKYAVIGPMTAEEIGLR